MSQLDEARPRLACPKCAKTFDAEQTSGICPDDSAPLSELDIDPLAGTIIAGKYQLIRPMEAGGWSVVYRARHLMLQKDVAVKVLHWHLSLNEEKVKRFHLEAEAASKLNHPNVVSVFDYGMLDTGQPYFVMELLPGRSLASILAQDGPVDSVRAAHLFQQAALGLAAAHKQGLLHRDLKPSNLMVIATEVDGEAETLKILDFGIAKLMTDVADDEKLTLTGETVGTPAYMSPEQCLGRQLDQRSDIYSLGCVMFEALTGEPCVQGTTAYDFMHGHVGTPPRSFREVRADIDVPKTLQDVIYTALAKHPDDRHPSMDALASELEQVAKGGSTFQFRRLRFRKNLKVHAKRAAVWVLLPVVASAITAFGLRSFLFSESGQKPATTTVTVDPTPRSGNRRAMMVSSMSAPDFPKDAAWLNVKKPLSMTDLKGKVVLLNFFTYCCVNCLNALPQIKRLEQKYGDKLVVIGVHSAKFENERETNNIRQAVMRWGIDYPVVNDGDFKTWQAYGVNAWPTIVLIGPDGKIIHQNAGEGNYDLLCHAIDGTLQETTGKDRGPALPISLERDSVSKSPLSYPAKVCVGAGANADDNLLYVLDSGHNRIVVARPDGAVKELIGSGVAGLQNGDFAEATFNSPQGICCSNGKLYVADSLNHVIRELDLKSRQVKTIAGTGVRAATYHMSRGAALKTPLSFPRDVIVVGDKIFISMAGFHQIWCLDPTSGQIGAFAGNGKQSLTDGPANNAELAQPCGIATDGKLIYFADSETSAIRTADPVSGAIKTLVGHGLFDSGDLDGKFAASRLQHPIGVTPFNNLLYITDAFNHKVKVLDQASGTTTTLVGSGKPGKSDGDFPEFFEPSGVAVLGDDILVADTNNNAIRTVSKQTGQVGTLQFKGLHPPER